MGFPNWYDLYILYALLALDAVSTRYALRHLVGTTEWNGAMRWLMNSIGRDAALVVTHVAVGWYMTVHALEIGVENLWVMSVFFALVCANNLRIIYIKRKE